MENDIDYNALFGVEEGDGGEPAETPESTETPETEGGKETAPAENQGGEEGNEGGDGTQPAAQPEAARSQSEEAARAAAEKAAKEEAQRFLDDAFAKIGMVNPYTKQPIKSRADFEAFNAQRQVEQRRQFQQATNMSEEQYNAFVAELPEVKQANEAKAQAERDQQAANEQQARARLEEDVKTISRLEPSIRSLQDVIQSESYPEVYKLVQKGYSLADAYKVANFDRLSQQSAAAAKQQTLNATQSKGHMTPTAARGKGAAAVPNEVAEMYRIFDPKITDAEIQADYARRHRK